MTTDVRTRTSNPRRTLTRLVAAAACLVVAVASFALSYVALSQVAVSVGAVPASMGWLVPIVIDGGIICGSAVIWSLSKEEGARSRFPFFFVAMMVVVSVVVNVAHAGDSVLAKVIAALPPLILLGTLELVAAQSRREQEPAVAQASASSTQPVAVAVMNPALSASAGSILSPVVQVREVVVRDVVREVVEVPVLVDPAGPCERPSVEVAPPSASAPVVLPSQRVEMTPVAASSVEDLSTLAPAPSEVLAAGTTPGASKPRAKTSATATKATAATKATMTTKTPTAKAAPRVSAAAKTEGAKTITKTTTAKTTAKVAAPVVEAVVETPPAVSAGQTAVKKTAVAATRPRKPIRVSAATPAE